MKIGVFSDVHGNLMALEAILADMRAQGVDTMLFAGDAFGEVDKPVETVDKMRGLPGLHLVRGNRERYLIRLEGEDQSTWTAEQYAPLYWNYHLLGAERRAWLYGLGDVATYTWDGLPPVTMAHEGAKMLPSGATERVDGERCLAWATPEGVLERYEMNRRARAYLAADEGFMADIQNVSPGVYICGHTHVQWHGDFDGRIVVNPGSCGIALDLTPGAPYTLLIGEAGAWRVEERRVAYDVEAAMASVEASTAYPKSPIFYRVNNQQNRSARLMWVLFMRQAERLAKARGRATGPVDNEIFHEAAAIWFAEHPDM